HAAPIVRNTNETPAKANPTTYQMPVNRTPFERRARGWRRLPEDPSGAQKPPEWAGLPYGSFYQRERSGRRAGVPGKMSGSGARRARVPGRAPIPVRSSPNV